MLRPAPGVNMAIFILFFGLATIDAVQLHAWWRVMFWLATGFVFLVVDSLSEMRGERSSR